MSPVFGANQPQIAAQLACPAVAYGDPVGM